MLEKLVMESQISSYGNNTLFLFCCKCVTTLRRPRSQVHISRVWDLVHITCVVSLEKFNES